VQTARDAARSATGTTRLFGDGECAAEAKPIERAKLATVIVQAMARFRLVGIGSILAATHELGLIQILTGSY
jgi:hypothetical protein